MIMTIIKRIPKLKPFILCSKNELVGLMVNKIPQKARLEEKREQAPVTKAAYSMV